MESAAEDTKVSSQWKVHQRAPWSRMKSIPFLPNILEKSLLNPDRNMGREVRKHGRVPSWGLATTDPSEPSLAITLTLWNIFCVLLFTSPHLR